MYDSSDTKTWFPWASCYLTCLIFEFMSLKCQSWTRWSLGSGRLFYPMTHSSLKCWFWISPPISTRHSFIMNREYFLTLDFRIGHVTSWEKGTEGTVFQFCVLEEASPSSSWPKFCSSFSFNSLWENPKLFGQPNIPAIVVIIVFPG